MKNLFIWVSLYSLAMAVSQVLLKLGTNQTGKFVIKSFADLIHVVIQVLLNPFIMLSMALMVSAFVFWLYILSWAKLGLVFPLTALTFVFVALISYYFLGERLSAVNYFGIILIASGVFFLLYR